VYQHSAVGRDLLAEVLEHFGAEAIPAGRSSTFVPIDTENIGVTQLARIQELVDEAGGKVDAVVSMDGDSDRPLLLGIERRTGKARFFGGDLLGMIAAQFLGADSVVVPVSCNDGIDRFELSKVVEPKTRIGSPYVIRGMEAAREKGRRAICGWEANGGFLTGSDIERNGRVLERLPTRDALLPLLCALFAAAEKRVSLVDLFSSLPARFSKAALVQQFPRAVSRRMVECYTPRNRVVRDVRFAAGEVSAWDEDGFKVELTAEGTAQAGEIRRQLGEFFREAAGFGKITHLNYTDGVRIEFDNGDIAHFRPSGNADELRIYAVADTQKRADFIAERATASDGILRRMAEKISPPGRGGGER